MKELEPKIQARPLNEFQNNSDEEGIMLYTPKPYDFVYLYCLIFEKGMSE